MKICLRLSSLQQINPPLKRQYERATPTTTAWQGHESTKKAKEWRVSGVAVTTKTIPPSRFIENLSSRAVMMYAPRGTSPELLHQSPPPNVGEETGNMMERLPPEVYTQSYS
jgi:hypothetical protein